MPTKPRGPTRMVLTIRSLAFMVVLGAVLALWNTYSLRRDTEVATGPKSQAQESFFVDAATRPDIEVFFQKLKPAQRLAFAQNIGNYTNPELAALCGKLLADFDPYARAALAVSLGRIALVHPEAVALELKEKGSFQYLGVSKALQQVGPAALQMVALQLKVVDARDNASAYLSSAGLASVPFVLPLLNVSDKDTRVAACEVLGKLRAREAVEPVTQEFLHSAGGERAAALASIASIAAPQSEALLEGELAAEREPSDLRAQAALGVGAIGDEQAARTLWRYANDADLDLAAAAVDGLRLCSKTALGISNVDPATRLRVASKVSGPIADEVVAGALKTDGLELPGAVAAAGRPDLVPRLVELLRGPAGRDGEIADSAVASLMTTTKGKRSLEALVSVANLSGIIERRKRLAG